MQLCKDLVKKITCESTLIIRIYSMFFIKFVFRLDNLRG